MPKVDWYKAELDYTTDSRESYSSIAKRFGVAKSTVVRRAKKEGWHNKRERFQRKRLELARLTKQESIAETDERHLKKLYMIQDVLNVEFSKLIRRMENEELSTRDTNRLFNLASAYFRAMTVERKFKGLNTKPVQVTNPEDMDAYLEAVGLKEKPVDYTYRQAKKSIESLDRLIDRRRRLQQYVDEVDKRGTY